MCVCVCVYVICVFVRNDIAWSFEFTCGFTNSANIAFSFCTKFSLLVVSVAHVLHSIWKCLLHIACQFQGKMLGVFISQFHISVFVFLFSLSKSIYHRIGGQNCCQKIHFASIVPLQHCASCFVPLSLNIRQRRIWFAPWDKLQLVNRLQWPKTECWKWRLFSI